MPADRRLTAPDHTARRYANTLLGDLGSKIVVDVDADHPALAWRRAGLSAITGAAEGPGLVCPAPLASAADGAMLALTALARNPECLPANGAVLLGERARLMHLARRGPVSTNCSCRLLACRDGMIALNLAREEDWALLPALFETNVPLTWDAVTEATARADASELVARGIEFGMAIALDEPPRSSRGWYMIERGGNVSRPHRAPRVIDLSSLWAGPLAGSLLAMLGADVVKVESIVRPDGARLGHAGFFALLNGRKQQFACDFADHAALAALIASADIIIESSRPRALQRLGIDAAAFVARGGIWLGITGHGRDGSAGNRVGFGDDAGVAAGLSWVMRAGWGQGLFAGDAIADPLTGIHAALVAWALWTQRRGGLASLSLSGVVRHTLALGTSDGKALDDWQRLAFADQAALYPMRPPC
jgi:hypothetical protein